MIKNILFVCTGNTCRSAMAEAMMKTMLKKEGITGISVRSQGIAGSHLLQIPDIVIELMKEKGIDISDHVSSPLTYEAIEEADLILAMEEFHRQRILEYAPLAEGKTFLLKKFALQGDNLEDDNMEILDPIAQPDEIYENCIEEIQTYLEKIIKKLKI
ncbi:MAG: low molecular weight protein arginine phosphatase [bacterium]